MKRTIIAVLLIVATLSFSTTAFAVDNVGIQKNSCREDMSAKVMLSATRISHIEDNTVLFLSESGINASLIPVCCLYNADDDIEALLYTTCPLISKMSTRTIAYIMADHYSSIRRMRQIIALPICPPLKILYCPMHTRRIVYRLKMILP